MTTDDLGPETSYIRGLFRQEPPRLKAATGDMPGRQFGPILANGSLDPGLGLVHTLGELAEIGIGRHVMTLLSRPGDFPELAAGLTPRLLSADSSLAPMPSIPLRAIRSGINPMG